MIRQFGYLGNVTFSSDWFAKSMQSDPVKLFSTTSYFIMIILTMQTVFYSKLEKIQKLKNKFRNCCSFSGAIITGNETNPNLPNVKMLESKDLIFGAGQSLIIVLISIAFFVPVAIVRRIARDDYEGVNGVNDFKGINSKNGKFWFYVSRVTLPTCYQFVFPLFLIANNSRMRKSLWRDLKESSVWIKTANLINKFRNA